MWAAARIMRLARFSPLWISGLCIDIMWVNPTMVWIKTGFFFVWFYFWAVLVWIETG
jgi:hypothetical protein